MFKLTRLKKIRTFPKKNPHELNSSFRVTHIGNDFTEVIHVHSNSFIAKSFFELDLRGRRSNYFTRSQQDLSQVTGEEDELLLGNYVATPLLYEAIDLFVLDHCVCNKPTFK